MPDCAGVERLLALLPSLKGQVVELSAATRTRLEELLLEGDLLEVSLDQTFLIHRVLQAASAPPREMLHTLIQVRSAGWTRAPSSSPVQTTNGALLIESGSILAALGLFVTQIELEEQRRSSRSRSKDKRKRKSHRGEGGEKGAQPSPEGSESKKTCPTSHSPVTRLHPEVRSSGTFC